MYKKKKVWFIEEDGKTHVVILNERVDYDRAKFLLRKKLYPKKSIRELLS